MSNDQPAYICVDCKKNPAAPDKNMCEKCYNTVARMVGAEPLGSKADKGEYVGQTKEEREQMILDTYHTMLNKPLGTKADKGKLRWSLLPIGVMRDIVAVLEFGAQKYSVGNWQHVDEPGRRYYDAAMRHIDARADGEKNDPDSGLPHLAHAIASLMFLMWFDAKGKC